MQRIATIVLLFILSCDPGRSESPVNSEPAGRVLLLGAVLKPQDVEWEPNLHLIKLITDAGGFYDFARLDKAIIYRLTPKRDFEKIIIDLTYVGSSGVMNEVQKGYLQPGDIVFIPIDPEKTGQQSVPGYPPQGVGSPEP